MCPGINRPLIENNKWREINFKFDLMATAAAVAESRGDLLAWLNDLLQLNISKIEHVGTGAPICQIFDSIFGMRKFIEAMLITF